MNPDTFSRRRMLGAAALAAPALAVPALPAEARQGNMERALGRDGVAAGGDAEHGRPTRRAMHLVERALYKVQAGD